MATPELTVSHVESFARKYTRGAIMTLVKIMKSKAVSPSSAASLSIRQSCSNHDSAEHGEPVLVANDRLPVDQARAHLEPGHGLDDGGIARRPVIPVAG